MTWERFALSRQLLAEESIGPAVRARANVEDAQWAASTRALQRIPRNQENGTPVVLPPAPMRDPVA